MFELLVVACIGKATCEFLAPPVTYETYAQCEIQAALIAGTVAGRRGPPNAPWAYQFRCKQPDGGAPTQWATVDIAAIEGMELPFAD